MGIISTTNLNTVAGTSGLSVNNGVEDLDILTYENATKQVSLPAREAVNISITTYLELLKLVTEYNQSALKAFFVPNQAQFTPFRKNEVLIENDGIDQLIFEYKCQDEKVSKYSCTYPSGTVQIDARVAPIVLSYAEWLYFLYEIADFNRFVLNAYNL